MWSRLKDEDNGTTLLEMLVGMTLMAIFGGLFTTAIYSMTSTANKAQALTSTSAQLSGAFLQLDKTVRYATALSSPGQSSGGAATGDWYAEMRTTNTGGEVCTQLRVDKATQQLQRRTWKVTNSTASGLTSWLPLASGITNGGAAVTVPNDVPFTLTQPNGNIDYQQLTVRLISVAGNPTTSSRSLVTFNAINISTSTSLNNVCQEVGRP
jgi:type II secretory pathway pseudopilin PulG